MADDDVFIINRGDQLVLPPVKRERVVLTGFPKINVNGQDRTPACYVHELTMPEYDEYIESNSEEKDGEVRAKTKGQNRRFLWWVMRDAGGHHLWSSPEDTERALEPLGARALNPVFKVANRLNFGAGEDVEGNSEGAPSGSSSGSSSSPVSEEQLTHAS